MWKRLLVGCALGVVGLLFLAISGQAEEAKKGEEGKFLFTLPVYLAEGLELKVDTPATEELLERASAQCIDAACKARVDRCKQDIAHCLLVPPRAALKENRKEAE
jgi:hypothetical protein